MRRKSQGLTVAVALLLAACVGTPAGKNQAPAAPVEVFDISSYRKAEDNLRRASADIGATPFPEPVAAGLESAADSGMRAEGTKDSPEPPEVLGISPIGREGSPAVELPLPAAPAKPSQRAVTSPVSPAGRPAASPRASNPSTRPAAPATEQKKTVARQPVTSPAAAVDPAPVKQGGSSGEARPAPREIYARVGDEVEIGLGGGGYVFLGFPDRTQAAGMSFKSKEMRGEKTYFKFKAFAIGAYQLEFLRQDVSSGKAAKEAVLVHVVSDDQFAAAVDRQAAGQAAEAGQTDTADYAYAEKLAGLGKYDAALAEYMKGYKESDLQANDRIAALYARTGDLEAAEKYYKRNLASPGAYAEKAAVGLARIALQKRDSAVFFIYLKPMLAVKGLDIGDVLIDAARFEMGKGEIATGLDLLSEYRTRYPTGARADEADVLTAQLLEADSPQRDIRQARELYGQVLGYFPESRFAALARDRLRYIEQHFFYVR